MFILSRSGVGHIFYRPYPAIHRRDEKNIWFLIKLDMEKNQRRCSVYAELNSGSERHFRTLKFIVSPISTLIKEQNKLVKEERLGLMPPNLNITGRTKGIAFETDSFKFDIRHCCFSALRFSFVLFG